MGVRRFIVACFGLVTVALHAQFMGGSGTTQPGGGQQGNRFNNGYPVGRFGVLSIPYGSSGSGYKSTQQYQQISSRMIANQGRNAAYLRWVSGSGRGIVSTQVLRINLRLGYAQFLTPQGGGTTQSGTGNRQPRRGRAFIA